MPHTTRWVVSNAPRFPWLTAVAAGEELEEPGEQADPFTVAPEEGRRPAADTGSPRFEREDAPAPDADTVARNSRPTGGQS